LDESSGGAQCVCICCQHLVSHLQVNSTQKRALKNARVAMPALKATLHFLYKLDSDICRVLAELIRLLHAAAMHPLAGRKALTFFSV
jgi:hypothetical protein